METGAKEKRRDKENCGSNEKSALAILDVVVYNLYTQSQMQFQFSAGNKCANDISRSESNFVAYLHLK